MIMDTLSVDSKRNFIHAMAGGLSGLSASLLVNPLDVIKIRVQNSSSKTSLGCFYDIWLKEGHKGFFRGISVTAVAYSVDKAIWFSVYVGFKDLLSHFFDLPEKSFTNQFYSSVLSSAITIVSTNPIWMIRTRFMTQPVVASYDTYHYKSIPHAVKTIFKNEGIRAFYKGMGASFLGISHVAIQFPLYEQLKFKFKGKECIDLISR